MKALWRGKLVSWRTFRGPGRIAPEWPMMLRIEVTEPATQEGRHVEVLLPHPRTARSLAESLIEFADWYDRTHPVAGEGRS